MLRKQHNTRSATAKGEGQVWVVMANKEQNAVNTDTVKMGRLSAFD